MTPHPPSATAAEKNHARLVGQRFADALARATRLVRSCGKLTGLDKIRAPIAWRAALKATGYQFEVDGMVLPTKGLGERAGPEIQEIASELYERAGPEIQEIASELYERAVKAARDA